MTAELWSPKRLLRAFSLRQSDLGSVETWFPGVLSGYRTVPPRPQPEGLESSKLGHPLS